jgi:hypothetical protein
MFTKMEQEAMLFSFVRGFLSAVTANRRAWNQAVECYFYRGQDLDKLEPKEEYYL